MAGQPGTLSRPRTASHLSTNLTTCEGRRFIPTCLPTVERALRKYGADGRIVGGDGSTDGSHELLVPELENIAKMTRLPDAANGTSRNHGAHLAMGDGDFTIRGEAFGSARSSVAGIHHGRWDARGGLPRRYDG